MKSEVYNGDLRELVAEEGATLYGDQPLYVLCPVHEDNNRPSLAVYKDHAHCYTCGAHLSRAQVSAAYSGQDKWRAKLRRQCGGVKHKHAPTVKVNVEALVMSSHRLLESLPDKLAYLYSRGLDHTTIYDHFIGYSGSAYVLPLNTALHLKDWTMVRFRRDDAVTTEGPKYWGLRGQNETTLYPYGGVLRLPMNDQGRIVVLTEGEFDALLLRQEGLNAYSFTNGANALPSNEQLLAWFEDYHVLLMRDQDAPGQEGTAKLARALAEAGVVYTTLRWKEEKGKDVTEVWQRDPEYLERLIKEVRSFEEQPV